LKKHNPTARLKKNGIRFVPYGTKQSLPVLGKERVMLQCEEGMYLVAGQTENLLGERDAVALGILAIRPRGARPNQETLGNIAMIKKEIPASGEISGGQSQAEIDQDRREPGQWHRSRDLSPYTCWSRSGRSWMNL
jgi:hypothetical protein